MLELFQIVVLPNTFFFNFSKTRQNVSISEFLAKSTFYSVNRYCFTPSNILILLWIVYYRELHNFYEQLIL